MTAGMRLRLILVAAVDLAVLTDLRPDVSTVRRIAALPAWVHSAGADAVTAAVAGAVVWLIGLWLAVGLLAGLASAAPGAFGRVARTLARATLPRTLYGLVAGAAGVGVLITCTGAQAATHRAPSRPAVAAPGWPTDDPVRPPTWPVSAAPARPAQQRDQQRARTPAPSRRVVVVRGDSLWRIAAAHLPGRQSDRRVAGSWPRWYAANRQVIGPDPDLITPGEVLHAPKPASEHERRS